MITMDVVEIFRSVQGEGEKTGLPCVFVRLFGCPNHCRFCDTKNSWEAGAKYNTLSISEIKNEVRRLAEGKTKYVVITGGEPFMQPIELQILVKKLVKSDYRVMIETSGGVDSGDALETLREFTNMAESVHINLSPKNNKVNNRYALAAHEIKVLIGATPQEDPMLSDFMEQTFMDNNKGSDNPFHLAPMFFQPIAYEDNEEKTRMAKHRAIQMAETMGCRVSFQIHKYAGLR